MKPIINYAVVGVYWWQGQPNLGDSLTPHLLRHFGFRPSWVVEPDAPLTMTGSVLSWLPVEFEGVVLGSGLMCKEQRRLPHAKYWAVRGPRTRQLMGAPEGTVLGDPGILADLLVEREPVEYKLGFIPHFADKSDERVVEFSKNDHVLTIDVQKDVLEILKDVSRCEAIISSSLHGLVVADAFGLPAAWLWSDNVAGNGFKFYDYHDTFGTNREPIELTTPENVLSVVKKVDVSHSKHQLLGLIDRIWSIHP